MAINSLLSRVFSGDGLYGLYVKKTDRNSQTISLSSPWDHPMPIMCAEMHNVLGFRRGYIPVFSSWTLD